MSASTPGAMTETDSHAPALPMPPCTSSRCSSAPVAVQISRAASRKPGGGTTTPASPSTGSRITLAVLPVTACRRASTSPYGTKVTGPGSGSKGSRLLG